MSEVPEHPTGAAPTPAPRRTHQKKMSPADKLRLAEILKRPDVRVDGKLSLPTVATLSGLTYQQVYGYVMKQGYLAAQVAEAEPSRLVPTEADATDTDDVSKGITITDAQFEEYKAMIRQNRKMLARDWQALGMTEEAGKRMEHYATLGTAPTSMVLRSVTGQLISNLELLDRVIKADCERVLTGQLPQEVDKNGDPKDPEKIDREWRHTVFEGMKLQLTMFSHVHKAQALMARVMADLHKMNGGVAPKAKGTFVMPEAAVSERAD